MATGRLTLLGTGTSTGVPVVGCRCPVCTSGDPRNRRSRCSALVEWDGRRLLIDTATDLRQQALDHGLDRIDAVLYTHTHADHVHGIDDLRTFNLNAGAAIPIYGSAETIAVIRNNFGYIFDDELEPGYRPRLTTRVVTAPFDFAGLPIVPIPLRHGRGSALGYRFGDCAYLTDCNALPAGTTELLTGLDTLVIDALRFRPHATHYNIAQALEVAAGLAPRRTLLTHLSHDVDHTRHTAGLPAGVEFACDGLSFSFTYSAPVASRT